jgi:hypothetical protein
MRVESRELLAGDYSDGRPKKGDRQRDNRPERASGRLLAAGVRFRAHTVFEDVSQLGRHLSELSELGMVGGVVSLDIRQVDDRRAQRRQILDVGIVADASLPAGNECRRPQRLVVLRQDDIERLAGLSKATLCDLKTSRSMSGAASMTNPNFFVRGRSPEILICRSASTVTQFPIEWARILT